MNAEAPLTPAGRRLEKARADLDAAMTAAKAAAVEDVRTGVPETVAARRNGLNRMTVRAALGKAVGGARSRD